MDPNETKGNKMKLSKIILTSLLLLVINAAHSSVQVMATRIIFDEKDKEQIIRVNNMGTSPSWTRVWLESDSNHNLDKINTINLEDLPFVVYPPESMINAGKGKSFRIYDTDDTSKNYARDRETLLWVNILDVPPLDDENENRNILSMAFKTKIKFFYRPDGLKSDPISAAEQVVWSAKKVGNKIKITGNNNNPYHVSMAKLSLVHGSERVELVGDMIKPFSSREFVFDTFPMTKNFKLAYTYISDLGGFVTKEIDLEI